MVNTMKNKILARIQKDFENCPDLIIKEIKLNKKEIIYVTYLETVTGSDKVNDYILKNLSAISGKTRKNLNDIQSLLPSPNTVDIQELDKIEFYITNGFTIVIHKEEIYAVETKADINRGIPEPTSEPTIVGPKDGFTENIQINLGLIKRRIKSHTLKTDTVVLGRKTTTMINILYIDDIAEKESVQKIKKELEKIDIDGLVDSGTIAEYLELENDTHFPSVLRTERPDSVANGLVEGKIAILVDTSPFALILPAFFFDFINPISDNYLKSKNVNFLKILRLSCFFFTMMIPGFYIAIINYNPETIPTSLLINFGTQRADVPFPAIVEALIMLIICEILKESDVRFPNSYGSAISILGALVLGEAAVSAGIVSPIMIIVIAFTFITSLLFTNQEVVSATRHFRFIFLFTASLYGLFGIFLALIYFFIHVTELTSLDKPYFYPIAPYDKIYLKKGILKARVDKEIRRSDMLTKKNKIRQRRNES